jgi:hypothetical protein
VTQAGLLAGGDAVLDVGMRLVAGLEELGVFARGGGGQQWVAPAVDFFEQGELRAG